MPSKADLCVWMRENKNLKCYEYLAIYVDDLCIAAQDPGKIIQTIKKDYKLKDKGDGPLSHHLGADYTRDKDVLPFHVQARSTQKHENTSGQE